MDNAGEVCLEEEVARRRNSGMSAKEIARDMGVDPGWVLQVLAMFPDEDFSEEGS